jgi:hypothetical protein
MVHIYINRPPLPFKENNTLTVTIVIVLVTIVIVLVTILSSLSLPTIFRYTG